MISLSYVITTLALVGINDNEFSNNLNPQINPVVKWFYLF